MGLFSLFFVSLFVVTEAIPLEIRRKLYEQSLIPSPSAEPADYCENHYYIYANHKKILANCPDGLIFDRKHKMCNYKEESMECPEFKYDIWLYRSKNETEKNNLCERKPDGKYSFRCENEHYECENGTVIWHKCPNGLVYNRKSCLENKCTKKEHNEECEQEFRGKDPKCDNITSVSGGPVISETVVGGDLKNEFSCLNKRNGNYKSGRCQNHFYICLNFQRFTANCPDGLVFSLDQCQYKRDAKDCSEYKSDLELYHSTNETERNSICEIKVDALYTFPCENSLYQCDNGIATFHQCPPGEVVTFFSSDRFDPTGSGCSLKELNYNCPEYVNVHLVFLMRRKYRDENRCESLPDGVYPNVDHCNADYFICLRNTLYHGACPENLVFSENNRCEYVKKCLPGYQRDFDLLRKYRNPAICYKKPDGPYIFECENEYYECKNGRPIWKSCPAGQVYNRNSCPDGCVEKIHAKDCPEFEEEHPKCSDVDWVELAEYNPDMGLWTETEMWHSKINYLQPSLLETLSANLPKAGSVDNFDSPFFSGMI